MTHQHLLIVGLVCFFFSCGQGQREEQRQREVQQKQLEATNALIGRSIAGRETLLVDSSQHSIVTRFVSPLGYERERIEDNTFAAYLRDFPLLAMDEKVHLYNGSLKNDQTVHISILDIDVGNRDLQQCADAVMRLRAEYLWKQQDFGEIAFNFTNGWKFEYSKWRAGSKLVVDGNKTDWNPGS